MYTTPSLIYTPIILLWVLIPKFHLLYHFWLPYLLWLRQLHIILLCTTILTIHIYHSVCLSDDLPHPYDNDNDNSHSPIFTAFRFSSQSTIDWQYTSHATSSFIRIADQHIPIDLPPPPPVTTNMPIIHISHTTHPVIPHSTHIACIERLHTTILPTYTLSNIPTTTHTNAAIPTYIHPLSYTQCMHDVHNSPTSVHILSILQHPPHVLHTHKFPSHTPHTNMIDNGLTTARLLFPPASTRPACCQYPTCTSDESASQHTHLPQYPSHPTLHHRTQPPLPPDLFRHYDNTLNLGDDINDASPFQQYTEDQHLVESLWLLQVDV